jgi:uncharacterized protein
VTKRGVRSHQVQRAGQRPKPALPVVLVLAVVVVAGGWLILRSRAGANAGGGGAGELVRMTDIQIAAVGGELAVPLATIKDKSLVRFVYKGEKEETPLLAYVAPSGKMIAAVSVCEPCASTRFFIQGNRIICSSCGSQWDLETLRGISGGCLRYPPDLLESVEKDGNLVIDEALVAAWRPRI